MYLIYAYICFPELMSFISLGLAFQNFLDHEKILFSQGNTYI